MSDSHPYIGRHVWVRNAYEDAVAWSNRKPSKKDILEMAKRTEPSKEEQYRQGWLAYDRSSPPVWIPAEIVKIEDGYFYCRSILMPSKTIKVDFEAGNTRGTDETLYPMNEETIHTLNNLSSVKYLHEASTLHALQTRFNDNLPYTFAGPHLVAMNPYKFVQKYGFGKRMTSPDDVNGMIPYYALLDPEVGDTGPLSDSSSDDIPPHPYLVANVALNRISNVKNVFHQAILMNGVSGSGKTTTSQMLIRYMIYVSQMRRNSKTPTFSKLEAALDHSLCLLNTFGSAGTSSNSSSSRFGKFVKVYWDNNGGNGKKGSISNAVIEAFHLDTSLLVSSDVSDTSNFRIFYQIESALSDVDRSKFSWKSLEDFTYTKSRGNNSSVDNNAAEYQRTLAAFEALGLKKNLEDVQRLLSAILNLGNIEFKDSKPGCEISNLDQLKITAEYLGVSKTTLNNILTSKTLSAGGSTRTKLVGADTARWRRDTLAKDIYNRLFRWIHGQCNVCLQDVASSSDFKDYYVGVLDFPGFAESDAEGSSLSRLLMNYASERFQKFYNEKIFTAEMEKYRSEKLTYQNVEFNDNDTVVKLMDSQQRPEGLFSQLEALASRSTGATSAQEAAFLTKLETIQLQRNVVEVHKAEKDIKPSFDVLYNNGGVRFNTQGLIDQNRESVERLPAMRNMYDAMKTSDQFLVSEIFGQGFTDEFSRGSHHASGQVTRQYVSEIKHLFGEELMRLECLFVRCIRPNDVSRPDFVQPESVRRQLRSLNVSSSVRFQQVGFPIRRLYRSFFLELFVAVQQKWEMRSNASVSFYLRWMAYEREAQKQRVTSKEQTRNQEVLRQLCQEALDLLWEVRGLPKKSQELLVQFGATKVFLKEEVPKILAAQKRDHERLMYSSATIIQTLARKYNARSGFLRTRAAVVDIQAHYKAEVMSREFDMKTRAVRMIHDQIKTHVVRKRWTRRREVARVTTHQIRANRSKERWKHVRKGLYVVHWIARGFLLRCHLLRYMEAIKTLQRAVRRFLVRNRHKWHKVVSALSIQALWRGYRIRQMRPDVVQYLRQKKYERTRSNAIRRLFATFRCDMVRRRFLDIKQSMATLQVTATASNAKRSFARLRDCSIRMQSLWRMKVAKQKLSEMRLNEMILKEQLRIKTLREREALLLARYNKYMDSEAMWHKRVEHQLKTGIRKTKTLDLTSVVDVDIMLDTSEIYPEGWMESFTRLEQHLCKEGADGVKQVSIGNAHSVVLAESGKLYSWGWGDRGQLGLSDWENQNRPKLLKTVNHAPRHAPKVGSGSFLLGGHGGGELGGRGGAAVLRPVDATVYVKFASISCGQDHCVAVTSEGQVFTWGSNSRGQLGLGDSKSRHRPTLIRSLRRQVRDAQCGAMHTICLMTGGSVYGWGAGVSSSSGSSSVDDTRRALALLPDLGRMSLNELKKHLRGLDPRRAKIIEKNVYELSSTEARKVIHEILHETLSSGGAGNRKARDAFYPVGLRFDSKSCIGQISIGWNVSVALCNSGAVYEFTPGNTPKRVRGIPSKVERVSAGARHIAALTRKGKLYMWGDNSFGQLGSGDKIDRPRGQDAVQIELPEGPVKTVTCGWRHTLALTRSGELYVWGHTLGYGFQGKGDMVEDETQEEHTSPVPLYVTEATDRCVEDVNCTFARNMSVSAVTIRQDEPEHVLTTVRRTGRKVSEKDVTRESDLARRIVQKLKHEDDEEVKYRKRMGISPRSVYKRVTGSVKKKKKKSSSPSRTIPKRELQKMGRRQLTELVKALRDEETSNKVSEHIASYNRDDEFLLGEAVYKTQNHLREDSAHHGAREIALENGWKRSMHRVESPEKREETYRAGIEYRTRWWNSVRTRGRRKGRVSRQDEDFVEKERRVVTEQKVESPSTTTTYEDNNSTFDPMMDSSNAMTIDEDDIREHFSKRFLIPRNLSNMEGKTRDGSDPLSLYRQYSRMQQQQNEDTFGNYNEEETGSSPVVVVPPESQYYGRTSSETERIRSEIRDKILNEHKDTNAEKADDLLSRHQNLGAVRSESFYERKLVKKESERGLNAFNAGRRVSTWRDLTPAERAERERKRLAVQKVKEEAKKRKQLMEQAEALKRQIEAEEQRRAQEKKMSVAARLEEIRNAVGATADTLWEGGDM